MAQGKRFRFLKWFFIIILGLLLAVYFTASMLGKKYINDHAEELLSQKAQLGSLSLGLFSGSATLKDLVVYEPNGIDTLVYFKEVYANISLSDLFSGRYVIQDFTIDGLMANIVQSGKGFNFDGIIKHLVGEPDTTQEADSSPIDLTLLHCALNKSKINYLDQNAKALFEFEDFSIELPEGIQADQEKIAVVLTTSLKSGGSIGTQVSYSVSNCDMQCNVELDKLNTAVVLPYLRQTLKLSNYTGLLSTNLNFKVNLKESIDSELKGNLSLENLGFWDNASNKVAGFDELQIAIDSVDLKNEQYHLKTLHLKGLFGHFELLKDGDNFSRLIIPEENQNISTSADTSASLAFQYANNLFSLIGHYAVKMVEDLQFTHFSLGDLAITNTQLEYVDHTMLKPFVYSLSRGQIMASGLKLASDSLPISITAVLGGSGKLQILGLINPQKPDDLDLDLLVKNMNMKDLSPYFYQYLAFPIDSGICNINTKAVLKDSMLTSIIGLDVYDFALGKKAKHEDALNLPLKLAVKGLKDRHGEIHIEVPVEGNLHDPNYKLGKSIGKIFKELIVKAATSPTKAIKTFGKKITELKTKMKKEKKEVTD